MRDSRMRFLYIGMVMMLLAACDGKPLNSPYPNEKSNAKLLHQSFSERPKTLDPAKAYSSNEYAIMNQIYEPPLQYHYLKRPYTLEPLTALAMPSVKFYNKNHEEVDENSTEIAYSTYTISLKKHISYAPHPAFALKKDGSHRYFDISEDFIETHDIEQIVDFKYRGSRELKAQDYIYQIKRLASPKLSSPILGLMKQRIVGLGELANELKKQRVGEKYLDLRKYRLKGVKLIDDYTYEITINGQYPQFMYWLAMPFFSPMPWEVDRFFANKALQENNLSLDWYPAGTGPFMLVENNPNRRMKLLKNPLVHPMFYPHEGTALDKSQGLLVNEGRRLPLLNEVLFSLEKESIPRWNKFLQGYYDLSGVNADSFDAAISLTKTGKPRLTKALESKGLRLQTAVEPSIFYMGFNMADKIVGGNSERARYLRQAISIAINYEEYIAIFLNGRGLIAQGPIPPGIDGYIKGRQGINPYVYKWVNGRAQRQSINRARELMAKAGYKDGIDKSGRRLILHYDAPQGQGPEQKAQFAWFRKQFAKLGISLNIRATEYNRFQQKMRNGSAQLFSWGWHADYPDPENFLFLLTSNNAKAITGGENAANYQNKSYDKLFDEMKQLPVGKKRAEVIKKMVALLQYDAPWVWGFYPKTLLLSQGWVSKTKLSTIGANTMKYIAIDAKKRERLQREWNKPVWWPLLVLLVLNILFFIPICMSYYYKTHHPRRRL